MRRWNELECKGCRHWGGTRVSEWGDCQHVIFDLLPMKYEDRFGDVCEAPFDPHDLRYYLSTSGIHKEIEQGTAINYSVVKLDYRKERVMWMDDKGEESIKFKNLRYLQTNKHYRCGRHEQ
jgi:hypothetical protein